MKYLLTLILLTFLCSCKEDKQPIVVPQQNVADTIKAADKMYKPIIKDKSLYSKEFVKTMQAFKYPSQIKVIDDYLIADGDTIKFPDALDLNKEYIFLGTKGNLEYELKVTRVNASTLNYNFRLTEKRKDIASQNGQAHLTPGFFLASDVYEDDKTGDGFGVNTYQDISENCQFYVGIGYKYEGKSILAIVDQFCDNETQNRNISADVTLRQHIE